MYMGILTRLVFYTYVVLKVKQNAVFEPTLFYFTKNYALMDIYISQLEINCIAGDLNKVHGRELTWKCPKQANEKDLCVYKIDHAENKSSKNNEEIYMVLPWRY